MKVMLMSLPNDCAEAIRGWQPWTKSMGPRSDEGKSRAQMNGYKGGHWRKLRELSREANALLRRQREALRTFRS